MDKNKSLKDDEVPAKVLYDIVSDADGWRISKTPSDHIILATLSSPFRFKWQAKRARRKLLLRRTATKH